MREPMRENHIWQFWKEQNVRVFRGIESHPAELMQRIKNEGDDWISVDAKHLGCLYSE